MDRNKSTSSQNQRGPKAKITQQPPDMFIALGAKQSSPRDDPKRSVPLPKPNTSTHLQSSSSKGIYNVILLNFIIISYLGSEKLKRDASSSSLSVAPPSKKIKVAIPGSRALVPGATSSGVVSIGVEPWEALALDCEPTELFESIMAAVKAGNTDKAVSIVKNIEILLNCMF